MDGMAAAKSLRLLDKDLPRAVASRRGPVGVLIARRHHQTNLIHTRGERLFDDDLQRRLGDAVPVHKGLKGKCALGLAGRRDDCSLYFQDCSFVWLKPALQMARRWSRRAAR